MADRFLPKQEAFLLKLQADGNTAQTALGTTISLRHWRGQHLKLISRQRRFQFFQASLIKRRRFLAHSQLPAH